MRALGLALACVVALAQPAAAQLTPVPGTPLHVVCDSGCGSPVATPDKGAFAEGTTSVTTTAGVYNDALAALSSGVSAAFRLTANRALHTNLRDASGNELGISGTPLFVTGSGGTFPISGSVTAVQGTGTNLHMVCDSGCGGAASFSDNTAFTAGTTAIGNIGAVFNDGLAAVTSGNAAAPRITAQRGLHINLRSAAGAELPLPAALAANGGLKIEGVAGGVAVPTSLATLPALVAGSAVIGHVIADTGSTTAVTALPALVAGSAVIGHVIVDTTSTTAVTQATGTNLHAVLDTGSTTAATQATAANLNAQVQGAAASGASKAGNPVQIGGVFNTTQPTVTTGQAVEAQASARGAQIVATGVDTFNVTVNAALPAGTAVIGHVIADSGSTTAVTGNVTVVQPTGTNLHAVLDATSTTAATQATGTNLHTVTDTTSVTILQPSVNAADALSSAAKATVTSSVNVKASAGSVYGFSVLNGAGAGCWMELINSATAGTIGTAVIFNIALPTSGTLTLTSPVALGNFSAGIAVGVASAVGGASACGTAATGITIFYK